MIVAGTKYPKKSSPCCSAVLCGERAGAARMVKAMTLHQQRQLCWHATVLVSARCDARGLLRAANSVFAARVRAWLFCCKCSWRLSSRRGRAVVRTDCVARTTTSMMFFLFHNCKEAFKHVTCTGVSHCCDYPSHRLADTSSPSLACCYEAYAIYTYEPLLM